MSLPTRILLRALAWRGPVFVGMLAVLIWANPPAWSCFIWGFIGGVWLAQGVLDETKKEIDRRFG